jgi:hypothetical protein
MRARITSSLFSVVGNSDGEVPQPTLIQQVFGALEQRPNLAARILDRVMPEKKEPPADADDDDAEEVSLEDSCVSYLLEKCAANESVTLEDAPLRALAVANPASFKEFLGLLNMASVEQVIEHLSASFDLARVVLRAPHVHAWFVRLKELVAAVS